MEMLTLGKTGLVVNKNGFGALPIQRTDKETATKLLRKAYENGVNYFDTARFYSDSEEKIGHAFKDVRENIFIASKTMAVTVDGFWADLNKSLEELQTDYIDVYQFHNPAFCPRPGDESGIYDAMLEAKEKGIIRHIGITNHRMAVAEEAIKSGLYETLQFPFNYLSTPREHDLVQRCKEANMGFISMKALSGGLLHDSRAAYAYQAKFDVLPIWGVQKESELDEFISYHDNPPTMTKEIEEIIAADQKQLMMDFCRGCGYCMPTCPAKIDVANCARMSLLLRRAPTQPYFSETWLAKMNKIEDCIHCGQCITKCPYGLNTSKLLEDNLKDYREVLAGKQI